ncbi:MAG: 3-dehydro-L-gulonate 2-dehydrogenase [Chitinophagaceae bacterium]
MEENQEGSPETIRISRNEMQSEFLRILTKHGYTVQKAFSCADVFTDNSVDGVYTHGVNRFPRFVQYTKDGLILPDAEPERLSGFGSLEQWKGNRGPGPLNALHATQRAVELSREHGMGCVTLSDTNHWMRGGLYGWIAARAGCVFIGWTNTIANMPAWGATDAKLGNNPLVLALPYLQEGIVLDMAMSQFSYGALELQKIKGRQLAVPGGYDMKGNLTTDPAAILGSQRVLPIGYWKGAGLSLLLDILATILSAGQSTRNITQSGSESGVSQVFIAIDISRLNNSSSISSVVNQIIEDYHQSVPATSKDQVLYPGERVLNTRKENLLKGIPVTTRVWNEILGM